MPKKGGNISLSSYDDIFQTDQSREEAQQERVQEIPLSELHPFKGHPFKVLDDEAMQKQSLSLSILLVADKVATDYLFRDGEYITIEQAKTVLINRNDLSDNERCYRYLQDKIAMNNQRFDMDTKVEKWGTLEKGVAIIYNQAFKELCKSGGFSDKAFLSWADRKGLIETQGGRMTKVDGNPIRCVFLRLNDNIDKDGFEPVETMDKYEQEELPFK